MVENALWLFGMCVILGCIVGTLAGLLGIGGGLVVVPALSWLLPHAGIAPDLVMHIALATSLTTIVLTASSSSINHMKLGNVDFSIIKPLAPGIILGALGGSMVAEWVPISLLPKIFAGIVLLLALQMLLSIKVVATNRQLPKPTICFFSGGVIGLIASLAGIAGGSLTVTFLSWCGVEMRRAIGTASVCGVLIGLFGMIGFILTGTTAQNLPQWSIGYIYLPALIGIVSTSIFTTRFGAKLATNLPTPTLKKIFAVFLLLVSAKMFLG